MGMEMNEKAMNHISIALAFDYLEEINYALVQSKMNICNWCRPVSWWNFASVVSIASFKSRKC